MRFVTKNASGALIQRLFLLEITIDLFPMADRDNRHLLSGDLIDDPVIPVRTRYVCS